MKKNYILTLFFLVVFTSQSLALSYYWKPVGASTSASVLANWRKVSCTGTVATMLPGSADTINFNCSNSSCVFDANFTVAKINMQSSYTGTASVNSAQSFTFATGIFKGGTFNANASALSCTHDITIDGTSFTSTSATFTITGDFVFKSGTFTHNSGTVVFKKGANTTTIVGGNNSIGKAIVALVFYKAEFAAPVSNTLFNLRDISIEVANELKISGAYTVFLNTNTGSTINALGNIISSNSASTGGGSSTILIQGTGTQTLTDNQGSGISGKLPHIYISKSSGTLTLSGNIGLGGSCTWEYNSGTVNAGTSTLNCFYNNVLKNSSGTSMNFYNLNFVGNGGRDSIAGTVTVTGLLATSATGDCVIRGDTLQVQGNLLWNNTATINFGNVTFKFTGGNAQTIAAAITPVFYKLSINKSGSQVTLQSPVTISNKLILLNGYLATDTTNLLTLKNGATVSGGSDASFVRGAVKKTGNSSFTFPIGTGLMYKPVEISAPSSATDAFRAQYFYGNQPYGTAKDNTLTYISNCEYWNIKRTAGTSNVKVTLYWNDLTCHIINTTTLRVAGWNSGTNQWENKGSVTISGTTASGSMQTQSNVSSFNAFVIAKSATKPTVNAGRDTTICQGAGVKLGGNPTASGGTPPYIYSWSPFETLDTSNVANPAATPQVTTSYILTVTDSDNTRVSDTVVITVNPHPIVNAGADRYLTPGDTITLGGNPTAAFVGSPGPAAPSYSWTPVSGLSSAMAANPQCFTKSSQQYSVVVTDGNGCKFNDITYVQLDYPWLGTAGNFDLLSGKYIRIDSPVTFNGKVGAADSITSTVNSRDSILIGTNSVATALTDLQTAIIAIKNLAGARLTSLSGTLTSGVYEISGNITLSGTLTLSGNANSLFILNVDDTLTMQNGSSITLSGINATQVYWNIGGNLHVNGAATLNGLFFVTGKTYGGTLLGDYTIRDLLPINVTNIYPTLNNTLSLYATAITRNDANEFLGFNGNNIMKPNSVPASTWISPDLRNSIAKLNSRYFRFPPGGQTKTWDINTGWFLSPIDLSSSLANSYTSCLSVEPLDTQDTRLLPFDRLYDMRPVLGGSDASLLLNLNLFQKDTYQMQMIQHALDLQLKVPYIELGNEWYLNGNLCPFYQPEQYAKEANHYLHLIHGVHDFPVNVGIVFSAFTPESNSLNEDCRRISFNAAMGLPSLSILDSLEDNDAFTFHVYPASGITHADKNDIIVDTSDIPLTLVHAFASIDSFANTELKILPITPHINAWVTEFDLRDAHYVIQGSWLHGLFRSIMLLRMLEYPLIKIADSHCMAQDGVAGALFEDNRGFDFADKFASIGEDVVTQPFGFTAEGLTIKMIAEAMRNCTSAVKLNFSSPVFNCLGCPPVIPAEPLIGSSSYPAFYGWQFNKASDTQVVILNLSPLTKEITVNNIFPDGGAYEEISSDPLYFLTGNYFNIDSGAYYSARAYLNDSVNTYVNIDSTNLAFTSSQHITLRPYSITRIYKTGSISLQQSGTYVCAHDALDTVNLNTGATAINAYLSGAAFYEFSDQPNVIYPSSVSISPPATNTSYTIRGYQPDSTYIGSVTFTVNVNFQPAVTVSSPGASCGTQLLVASGADAYDWWPTNGVDNVLNDSVSITPTFFSGDSLRYRALGIRSSDGCTKQVELNFAVSPAFDIVKSGGVKTATYPYKAQPCRGEIVTMTATGNGTSYTWNASDGSVVNEVTTELMVSPDSNVLYSVTAESGGCSFTRYVWVEPQPVVTNDRDGHVYTCTDTCTKLNASISNCSDCSYEWQTNDSLYADKQCNNALAPGFAASNENVRFLSSEADTFQYNVYGIDSGVCLASGSTVVNVYVNTAQSITANAVYPFVFQGATDTLYATPNTLGDYTWTGCGMNQSVGYTITITPFDTCTYTVTSSNNGCCSSDAITIYTCPLSLACGSEEVCSGCAGDQKTLTASILCTAIGTFTYKWYTTADTLNPVHTDVTTALTDTLNRTIGASDTTYYCRISGGNVAGEGITNQVTLKPVFLPNGSTCQIIYNDPNRNASAAQAAAPLIKLYPNPASGKFTLEFSQQNGSDDKVTIQVRSFMGALLQTENLVLANGWLKQDIDLNEPAGIYLVTICTSNCFTRKIIITK